MKIKVGVGDRLSFLYSGLDSRGRKRKIRKSGVVVEIRIPPYGDKRVKEGTLKADDGYQYLFKVNDPSIKMGK